MTNLEIQNQISKTDGRPSGAVVEQYYQRF